MGKNPNARTDLTRFIIVLVPRTWVDDGCEDEQTFPGGYQLVNEQFHYRCCSSDGGKCESPVDCENEDLRVTYAEAQIACSRNDLADDCCYLDDSCDKVQLWTSDLQFPGIFFFFLVDG